MYYLIKQYRKIIAGVLMAVASTGLVNAQSVYQPYSYQFYQKFSADLYSVKSGLHTAMKPYLVDDSLLKHTYDSLMNVGVKTENKSWGYRKLYIEHLVDVQQPGYTIYADILPDLETGYDFTANKSTWQTTLGYQVGGTIGSKFSFYGSGFNNRALFADYITAYAITNGVVPGQTRVTGIANGVTEWSYYTGLVSYTPVKYVNFAIGQDKNFIGDGYRSMILSDYASPYPFAKITLSVGSVKYMAMLTRFEDAISPRVPGSNDNRIKWGYFHYLDWSISNRVSVGFFDSVVSADQDSVGNKRGVDYSYLNPFVFLRPVEASHGSPDKADLGLTAKWKFADKNIVYGQFALTEFNATDFFSNNGSSRNKYGWQLGIRGADVLKVKGLNYLFEYNTAKPYTYSETESFRNYAQYNEPLTHPFGANFREWLGIVNYSAGRFDFQGQLNYAYYGLDVNGLDYGKDIFKSYLKAASGFGNFTGQGLRTNFYYASGKVAYILNPKYNLRLELGAIYRKEGNVVFDNSSPMISFGLRSSFRNLYTDGITSH
jgi:hypothetical protein